MIVYLHSVDVSDAGRTFGRHRGQDVLHVQMPTDTAVSRAAEVVRSATGIVSGTIDLLVINTHCSPGRIHLSGVEDDTYDVSEQNVELFAPPFAPMLKPADQGGQGVEIHGCYVAAGSVDPRTGEIDDPDLGLRFLYLLACGFRHQVMGTASPQVSDSAGLFEDDVVIAMPDSDPDWHGHLCRSSDPRISHRSSIETRIDAFFTSLTWRDPRESFRTGERLPPHPGWDRR